MAILAGGLLAALLIAGVEWVGGLVYPLPEGLDPQDPEALRRFAGTLPAGAFGFLLAAWALGTFAGAWLAGRIAGRTAVGHGMAIGALFLVAGIANMLMIPHPIWVWVLGIAVFVGCGYAGGRVAAGRVGSLGAAPAVPGRDREAVNGREAGR